MKDRQNIEDEVFLAQWLEGKLTDEDLKLLVSEEDYTSYLKLREGIEVFEEKKHRSRREKQEIARLQRQLRARQKVAESNAVSYFSLRI